MCAPGSACSTWPAGRATPPSPGLGASPSPPARTIGKYAPPPPQVRSPMLWGTPERLRERMAGALDEDTRRSFAAELAGVPVPFNRSGDGTLLAAGDYLEAVGTRR
ncbi:hypothetical protein ACGFI3_12980 [Nonomuraea wenchangensis]